MADGVRRETVFDTEGRPYHLTRLVARGGQGAIYEEASGTQLVKITRVRDAAHFDEIYRRYRWLLKRKMTDKCPLIVPEALLAPPRAGYVMHRVRGHQPLAALLHPPADVSLGQWYNIDTGGLRRRLRLAGLIARAFHSLHINGLAYCDLSDNNILIAKDPTKASICIVDPDSLSVSGAAQSLALGTPRFMAPEILRGSHQPDALSDSYSLAVIIFQILRLNHPLLGDEVQNGPPEREEAALRGELPYIDHPIDASNHCTTVLPEAATCTQQLEQLFQRAFVDGLSLRTARPTASEWEEACLLAVDATTTCPHCQATFYPRPDSSDKASCICPWCGDKTPIPARLEVSEYVYDHASKALRKGARVAPIVLRDEKTAIRARQSFRGNQGEEGDRIVAVIHQNNDNGTTTLENRWESDLLLVQPRSRTPVTVKPKQKVSLLHNSLIYFEDPLTHVLIRAAGVSIPGGSK